MKCDARAFRGEDNIHILFLDPGGGGGAKEILVLLARFEHSKLIVTCRPLKVHVVLCHDRQPK